MRNGFIALCFILLGLPAVAQQRDFLTAREVDEVRQVQEPDQRLLLYLTFAETRIEELGQLFAGNRPGRSVLIHDLLDQYGKIIDAMDTVTDDALSHHREIGESLKKVTEGQAKLVARLEAWKAAKPKDLDRYEFVLANAIDTTHDSISLNQGDLGERKAEVVAKEKEEKKERREMMTPESANASVETEKKEKAQQRKAPSLYRKGEKKEATTPPDK
jgi:hypothetical protein